MHVIATAGHVDHGKSTLVRALTGMEPDRLAEERRRGLSVELGFAWTTLPTGETVAFVDVPGHERFVTTMLAGVGPVPAVLFVVAADEGFMPQSEEHLDALAALGVDRGLLVISRCDLADPGPALAEARSRLAETSLAAVPAVCVSATTGAGMAELRSTLDGLVAELPDPDPAADVRLWIDRAFTIRGAGTVVTGTLGAGRIRVGDEVALMTSGTARPVAVRGLQSLGVAVDAARGVGRVAVNLRGVPLDTVSRGDVLLTPGAWLGCAEIDVRLDSARALPAELSLHIGAACAPARVRPLGADTARLRLRHALPLRIGDRGVLREPARHRIAAGATVLDVRPPQLRRRGSAARRAAQLATMDAMPSAAAELARRGVVRRADLVAMGLPRTDVDALRSSETTGPSEWLIDGKHAQKIAADLAAAVAKIDPLDPGMSVEAARRAVALPHARLVEDVLVRAGVGLAVRDGCVVRSVPDLPARVRTGMDALRADLVHSPFAAPDAARLAELGLGAREIAALVRAGELLRLTDGVVLLAGADAHALDVLAGLCAEFTLSAARQALRTTRRVAVPLLEHLARAGHTTRTPAGTHRLKWQYAPTGPTVGPVSETRGNSASGPSPIRSGGEVDDQIMLSVRYPAEHQVYIEVGGEVDMLTSPHLRSVISEQFAPSSDIELVVLGLDGVTFLGTSGLAVLIEVREAAHAAGVELRLACTARRVLRPLTIAGLIPLFDIHDTLREALAAT